MSLKEKCYAYQAEVNYFLDDDKYIIAHIDGRSFSKMIKNKFKKPFDDTFIEAMNETAKYLCKEVQGCIFAYTQSDEISLIIRKNDPEGDVFFWRENVQNAKYYCITCHIEIFTSYDG